jgi:hypothetical protein
MAVGVIAEGKYFEDTCAKGFLVLLGSDVTPVQELLQVTALPA